MLLVDAGLVLAVTGSVRINEGEYDGAERELGRPDPGTVWGEVALLEEAPSPVALTALRPPRWWYCPFGTFARRRASPPTLRSIC
jgi:CRP-like cAMP-binding protein